MTNLIERLEAAKGPSRELFWEAFEACGFERFSWNDWSHPDTPELHSWARYSRLLDAEAWTSAAEMLVPTGEGRWPQLDYVGPNPNDSSKGHRWAIWLKKRPSKACRGHNKALSALALAAAALRAREADRG